MGFASIDFVCRWFVRVHDLGVCMPCVTDVTGEHRHRNRIWCVTLGDAWLLGPAWVLITMPRRYSAGFLFPRFVYLCIHDLCACGSMICVSLVCVCR